MDLKVNGIVYNLTAHAKHRMKKRNVSVNDVVQALDDFKFRRKQTKHGYEDRVVIVGRNKVTIVITIDNVILTAYNYKKEYSESKLKQLTNKNNRHNKKKFGNRMKN